MPDIPVGLIRDISAALSEALKNISDTDSLEATSLKEALIEVIKYHPEILVAGWIIAEIQKLEKKEGEGSNGASVQ